MRHPLSKTEIDAVAEQNVLCNLKDRLFRDVAKIILASERSIYVLYCNVNNAESGPSLYMITDYHLIHVI